MAALAKFWKRTEPLSKVEEQLANVLLELENSSSEYKKDLKNFFLDSVREVEVVYKNKKNTRNVLLVTTPYVCNKVQARLLKSITAEVEKRVKATVLFHSKRKIASKWIKAHKSQQRPRNQTLTAVYDSLLNDLCAPSVINGKRIRCRVDGTRFYKVFLDSQDQDLMEDRLEAITQVYKKLTTRELVFEFRADTPFYSLKL